MTHSYQLSGLTCGGCEATVKKLLTQITDIQSITINESRDEATISMTTHIPTDTLKAALKDYPKYQINDKMAAATPSVSTAFEAETEDKRSWLETYKPLLLILSYVAAVSYLASSDWMSWMRYFMAGFFLVFSFFKLLDLRGFADSYRMYDVVARVIPAYGYVYPFLELALGAAFLTGFDPFLTNIVALIVMGVSAIGVFQSVLDKRKIKCVCLGSVFNLPMSTVTIVEDLLMVAMSAAMLWAMQPEPHTAPHF